MRCFFRVIKEGIPPSIPLINHLLLVTVLTGLCTSQIGCQFAPVKSPKLWPWKKDAPPEMPERVLAVWSDSVLHQPGQPGVRGFGGRIYFYQTSGNDPVKVDGALAVYVFDADELDPYNQKPLRKFMFTADQFEEHLSTTTLGPSYSVWLPFDEVGGEARRLSLISRFEGREGGTVISEPTIKLLPGMPKNARKDKGADSGDSQGAVRMAGHLTRSSEQVVSNEALGGRTVQTIDLPPNFNRRLASSVSEVVSGSTPDNVKPPVADFISPQIPISDGTGPVSTPNDRRDSRPDDRPLRAPSDTGEANRNSRSPGFIKPPR
jgi:hypothetical protein